MSSFSPFTSISLLFHLFLWFTPSYMLFPITLLLLILLWLEIFYSLKWYPTRNNYIPSIYIFSGYRSGWVMVITEVKNDVWLEIIFTVAMMITIIVLIIVVYISKGIKKLIKGVGGIIRSSFVSKHWSMVWFIRYPKMIPTVLTKHRWWRCCWWIMV